MADLKISELTSSSSVLLGDLLVFVTGGTSKKVDVQTLALNMPSRIVVKESTESVVTGAIALNILTSKITSTTAGAAYTLSDGITHGIEKEIVCEAISGGGTETAVLTVTNGAGFTTVTFSAVGDTIKLKYIDGSWYVISSNGIVLA